MIGFAAFFNCLGRVRIRENCITATVQQKRKEQGTLVSREEREASEDSEQAILYFKLKWQAMTPRRN